MSIRVVPKPEFQYLTEAEIERAITDPNPGNPVACEVARLLEGYTKNFRLRVQRLGRIPESILRVKPRFAIEAVAMRLLPGMCVVPDAPVSEQYNEQEQS